LSALNTTFMCFSEFRVDNSQCKVEKEESTAENDRHEIYNCKVFAERFLYHDLNVTPAFKRHGLKYSQEREHHVVEVGSILVGVVVAFATKIATRTIGSARAEGVIWNQATSLDVEAPLFEKTFQKLTSSD